MRGGDLRVSKPEKDCQQSGYPGRPEETHESRLRIRGAAAAPGLGSVPSAVLALLGLRTRQAVLQRKSDKCAHCGDHMAAKCPDPERPPAPGSHARTEPAEGSSTEENTDHVSLRFIQSNLQRSKLATSELLVEADRRKIAVALVQEPYVGNIGEVLRYPDAESSKRRPAKGTRKAAIIVLDSSVDVEEDQTLIDENVTAAVCSRNCRIGVVSVYSKRHPIGPYPIARYVCSKLGTDKIILGATSTRGVYGGAVNMTMHAGSISAISSILRAARLERRHTPMFEVYGTVLRSVVDVTACGSLTWIEWRNGRWSEM
ncbi:hypothetical protein EVAR_90930_1 [Eumeta japonica]|uniref:115 kDa protein in type-1 retrotransposable element R1DM n=1 Tax=Eumeta variegata TaxID=151549 RepID=A0A4C2AGF7_EUMVA|nr:hypothetical protein EVAR_90930_1 [Eumeta japonica]